MENWIIALIIGVVLILSELVVGINTGFDLVLIGSAIVLGSLIGSVTSDAVMLASIFTFCLIYILMGRKYIKGRLSISDFRTNIDRLISSTGVVTETINPLAVGKVKIGSEIWLARSPLSDETGEKIEVGENVIVMSVSGVTLLVEKIV